MHLGASDGVSTFCYQMLPFPIGGSMENMYSSEGLHELWLLSFDFSLAPLHFSELSGFSVFLADA